jgi:hypothetical protein
VAGTLTVRVNGTETSASFSGGLITLTAANGAEIRADFEFMVPVRFEQDAFVYRFLAIDPADEEAIASLDDLTCLEVKAGSQALLSPRPTEPLGELDLGYSYETEVIPAFSTRINGLDSGLESRAAYFEEPRYTIRLGDRLYDRDELDVLLGCYRAMRGNAYQFRLREFASDRVFLARFDADFNIQFSAFDADSGEAFYQVSGVTFYGRRVPEIIEVIANQASSGFTLSLAGDPGFNVGNVVGP